ncbi:MAG TPA: hypothetical protein VGD69_28075 [Herpetosiphonaceae bacterium]
MQCPICASEVSPGPSCSRCGAALTANSAAFSPGFISNTAPIVDEGPARVPLTFTQRARLIGGCVPLLGFTLMLIVYLALQDIFGPPPLAFLLFAAFVILVLGYYALQRLRDLISGTAVVQTDVLERSWSSSGPSRSFYGKFTQLGRMQLVPRAHFQSTFGKRYRVHYSPASKIVWRLEPLR